MHGRACWGSAMASSAYLSASAPPLENPTRCRALTAACGAALRLGEPRGRRPVFPFDIGQSRRNGAVPAVRSRSRRSHGRDRHDDVALAIRRVWSIHGAAPPPPPEDGGLQYVRAMKSCAKEPDRAAPSNIGAEHAHRRRALRNAGSKLLEDFHRLLEKISIPICCIELGGLQLMGHVGVPDGKRRSALRTS